MSGATFSFVPWIPSQKKLITAKNKKAWNPYLLLAPRLEALALPILLEQATQNPRQYENSTNVLYTPYHNGHLLLP